MIPLGAILHGMMATLRPSGAEGVWREPEGLQGCNEESLRVSQYSSCWPLVLQTATRRTAKPTKIPAMPMTMLKALTGRSCPLVCSLRSATAFLPISNTPSLPVNPASHRIKEMIITTRPRNHTKTDMSLLLVRIIPNSPQPGHRWRSEMPHGNGL